ISKHRVRDDRLRKLDRENPSVAAALHRLSTLYRANHQLTVGRRGKLHDTKQAIQATFTANRQSQVSKPHTMDVAPRDIFRTVGLSYPTHSVFKRRHSGFRIGKPSWSGAGLLRIPRDCVRG